MPEPATERAFLPLLAGIEIENISSPGGKTWKESIDTVSLQPGYQRCYWGRQVENPSVLEWLIDWDSVDAHKKFTADPAYGPFAKHIMTIVDGAPSLYHVNLTPHPPSAAVSSTSSPVTEALTLYFPSSISSSEQASFEENFKKFIQALEKHAEGFRSASGGWVVEEVEHESVEGKGKAFFAALGWESVEKHVAFRDTQEFKDNIGLLRDGPKGIEVHHVKFQES